MSMSSSFENHEYDVRGRLIRLSSSDSPTITYSYSPNTVTSTKNGHTVEKKYDLWGNIKKITDASGIVNYTYGSHGQPLQISYDGKTISMAYDALGRKVSMNDPDAGTMTYTYDDFDRVITECDALNHQTQNTYDANGFLTQSETDGITTNYVYGQQASNRFLLLSTTRGYCSINYTYDNLGRIESERRRINGGDTLETRYTYNNIGQLSTKQYVGGPTVTYTYDAYGFEDEIKCNNILISKPLGHTGTLTSERRGMNLTKVITYYINGQLETLNIDNNATNSTMYSITYFYDEHSGNIEERSGMFPWYEDFTYDSLDRLTLIEGNRDHNITYTPDGNISYQTGIGHYYYDSTKPHAVTLVENTDRKIPLGTLYTTYNSFGKIQTIENESGTTSISFVYGPDNERWKSVMSRPVGGTRTIYYMGDCEKIVENGHTRRLYYLDGDVIYIKQDNLSGSIYFTFKDHLGSIVAIVDYNGNEVFKAAYDAWGNRTLYRNDINFHRGFTGHEMLPEFGLINMNGRLYDPLLGRFLSTDNFVQEPTNSQNFNRYTYCLNNPLKYTDPSGEFFLIDSFIAGFIRGMVEFFESWDFLAPITYAINNASNDVKITFGLLKGSPGQILSRFTWELPQTIIGWGYSQSRLIWDDVDRVEYFDGATYVINENSHSHKGVTIGNYININDKGSMPVDENGNFAPQKSQLYMHEYGHYLQSQQLGLHYLVYIGIPSLISAATAQKQKNPPFSTHSKMWFEKSANRKAKDYFSKNYNVIWDETLYPL